MTKAEQIRDLLEKTDLTRKEIAEKAGCLQSYVRTVEQRLAGSDPGERYRKRDPARHAARMRDYYRRNPDKYLRKLASAKEARRRARVAANA